jgi:hypothetical protein
VKDHLDLQTFMETILDTVAGVVQYSGDNTNYQPFPLQTMCSMLSKGTTPGNLASVVLNITAFGGVRMKRMILLKKKNDVYII